MSVYVVLDWFFMVLHTAIILFNLFGWIWKKTRKVNLILLLLTGSSWLILGIWKGVGYCPLTDWHFEVLQKLGEKNIPQSYIKYLVDRITGWNIPENLTDRLTVLLYLVALICSVIVNTRSKIKSNTDKTMNYQ